MEDRTPLLSISNLSFSYFPGAKRVLSNINLDLFPGELHLLIGENGAGKSTLASCIAGNRKPGSGRISGSPSTRLLSQHLISIPETTFQEYLWLIFTQGSGRLPHWSTPGSRKRKLSSILEEALGEFFNPESLDEQVALTSSNLQHLYAAILLLNRTDARMVILDEPTAVLSEQEAGILYENITRKTRSGLHVTVITHRLDEALPFSDRYTVIRNGRIAAGSTNTAADQKDVIHRAMFGGGNSHQVPREIPASDHRSFAALRDCGEPQGNGEPQRDGQTLGDGTPLFSLHNVHADFPDLCPLQDVSFSLEPGEVLSITGIRDEGLEQLERLLSGRFGRLKGSVGYMGKALSLKNMSDMRKRGIRFVPSQRNRFGLARSLRGFENIGIHMIREQNIPWKHLKREILKVFDTSGLDLLRPSGEYSGGMVQRMILHRELFSPLSRHPALFILADPSWGLDAQRREKLYDDIRSCVQSNAAALVISSELTEAIALGDRVAIIHEGKIRFPDPEAYADLQLMERYFLGQMPEGNEPGMQGSGEQSSPGIHDDGGCVEAE
ncbi:ATP-binding cassette domain-containing protein [Salinispira pacifica]|uniref:ABC transporter domain-containing protein n=1 Tax=Salinispira pacifica TaxID=1307761 RepID=V5WHT5_9SPIO|nr:ATP-binding cassette domain-containing protein [Salinispira pacifica]AHC15094.1 hypothetical protein L21SP2_1715 [Salinispira pacifica]